ncbi:MAG: 50S ribosomal protein L6 [Acidobacteria bacterium]|nr:50S ribosomal protein L6 [Acidobacteriota bacterium]
MSRIGKQPIPLPAGVKAVIAGDRVQVESPKGRMVTRMPDGIRCEQTENSLRLHRRDDSRPLRALHGTVRAHIANAVRGVTVGFRKELDIIGIGYRAQVQGRTVVFQIGHSHPIKFPIPEGLEVKVDKQTHLVLTGCDRQRVGQVAAEMRALRPPEPYKGKGIRYSNEFVRKKAGKAAKAGATA